MRMMATAFRARALPGLCALRAPLAGIPAGMLGQERRSLATAADKAAAPVVLLAKHKLLPGKEADYMAWAATIDKAVEDSEPGMLVHTLDADPSCPLTFTWTEVRAPALLRCCMPPSCLLLPPASCCCVQPA
jgi:hypothetical protein